MKSKNDSGLLDFRKMINLRYSGCTIGRSESGVGTGCAVSRITILRTKS